MLEHPELLIDIGNSSIKYCFYRAAGAGSGMSDVAHVDKVEELFPLLTHCHRVYVSNVGKPALEERLQSHCHTINKPLQIATTQASHRLLKNAYATPKNMGVDRWLAMLACASLDAKDFVVIDLGTAITTDFVIAGVHQGGWIAPGFQLLCNSLTQRTQNVFFDSASEQTLSLGVDTPQCVEMGAKAQIIGSFELAVKIMQKNSKKFTFFITGGDKSLLDECEEIFVQRHNNLVLHGLTLLVD